MSEPKRWLIALEEAPNGASQLLSAYSSAAPMPADVHGRLLAKATELSMATKSLSVASLLASKPGITVIAAAIAGAGVLATARPAVPLDAHQPLERGVKPVKAVAIRSTELLRPPPEPVERVLTFEELLPELPANTRTRTRTRTRTMPTPPPKREPVLAEEVLLVDQARSLLEQDPAGTLRVCGEHELRFSDGQLRSTREAW